MQQRDSTGRETAFWSETDPLPAPLPVIGWLLGALPDPLRWGLLPLALVVALLRVTLDGRPAHRALWAIARWRLSSRWLAGLRRCPPPHGRAAVLGTWVVRPDWGWNRAPHQRANERFES